MLDTIVVGIDGGRDVLALARRLRRSVGNLIAVDVYPSEPRASRALRVLDRATKAGEGAADAAAAQTTV